MRVGTPWRVAVLASLALHMSGQLCMLTTCVPRLASSHPAAHACCRAPADGDAPSAPAKAPVAPGAMPCSQAMHPADAPALSLPLATVGPVPFLAAFAALLAPPARVDVPRAPIDTGPPVDRQRSAPAGLRAPPQA